MEDIIGIILEHAGPIGVALCVLAFYLLHRFDMLPTYRARIEWVEPVEEPVSYTHLDVYKRQPDRRVGYRHARRSHRLGDRLAADYGCAHGDTRRGDCGRHGKSADYRRGYGHARGGDPQRHRNDRLVRHAGRHARRRHADRDWHPADRRVSDCHVVGGDSGRHWRVAHRGHAHGHAWYGDLSATGTGSDTGTSAAYMAASLFHVADTDEIYYTADTDPIYFTATEG